MMDFSTHSHGPKDPSPDHAELVEAVTKGMLILGTVAGDLVQHAIGRAPVWR